ncbi:hypothetical protein JW935_10275 [candidate division KSB1 bacterium]|nr:hypothetical protein [candidate division KSB1 bacterium]
MKNQQNKRKVNCDKYRPEKEYSHLEAFLDNLPYIFMAIFGGLINLVAFKLSVTGIILSLLYILYCIVGAFWIMIFVCPYCQYFDTKLCPCGYGQIAVKFRDKNSENKFSEKFKKHIPVIVPLWIIPVIEGIVFLVKDYNLTLLILVVIFAINSFIILPLLARIYGCGHCPQKDDCPWMV